MAKKRTKSARYPSATKNTRNKANAAVGGSATPRNQVSHFWAKRVQWQVPGGWFLRIPERIAGRAPMAIYFGRRGPVAYQYFLDAKTLGVEVLP